MKIALGSDWHIGEHATTEKQLVQLTKRIASENPDVLVLAGDFNGGNVGYKAVNRILKIVRDQLRDVHVISVNGNHDFWLRGDRKRHMDHYDPSDFKWHRPKLSAWVENAEKVVESYRRHGVHFLDKDGVWRDDTRFPGYAIVGHTGWYNHLNPPTNDALYMSLDVEGNTHAHMSKKAYQELSDNLAQLQDKDTTRIFVSHFPVVEFRNALDHIYGGSPSVGEIAQNVFGCKIFLNGHAHQRWEGPLRYEAGSDYGRPRYLIVEV